MTSDGKGRSRRRGTASPLSANDLVEILEHEREMSRRGWLGAVGRVFLAGAAYEVASLGLAGCAAYKNAFRASGGPAWTPMPLSDYRDGRWAGLQLGVTTVDSLEQYAFAGDVAAQPDLGRIELIPAGGASTEGLPRRVVLSFRDAEDAAASLDGDAILAHIDLEFLPGSPVREGATAAFGAGEEVYYGTRGSAVRTYLLYRDVHALCGVEDAEGGSLWVTFYEPDLLHGMASRLELCTVQCTWCTSSCTGCTEQCTLPCTARCTGCTSDCTAGCTASCTSCLSCTAGCTAACTVGCTVVCTACTGACTMGCTTCTSCTYSTSCYSGTSCHYCTHCTGCTASCTAGCTAMCTWCTTACTVGCTICTYGCTACTGCTDCTRGCVTCTACTDPCTTCTACTACTTGCTGRTGSFDG